MHKIKLFTKSKYLYLQALLFFQGVVFESLAL